MNALHPHGHIALTQKGEVYAVAHPRPTGCPVGVDPATWRRAVEARAETLLDIVAALMASLDQMDGDAEAEVDTDDEDVDEDGGNITDEPHDGCLDLREGQEGDDLEPFAPSWFYPNGSHIFGGGSGI